MKAVAGLPTTTLCVCTPPLDSLKLVAATNGAYPGALASGSDRWKDMHIFLKKNDCTQLGHVPTFERACFNAERCIHTGDGELLKVFQDKYQSANKDFKKFMTDKVYKLRACIRGDFVVRFSWSEAELQPGDATPPTWPPMDPAEYEQKEIFVHISYAIQKPQRPTFTQMEANSIEDDPGTGLRGVSPCRDTDGRRLTSWRTIWEIIDGLHLKNTEIWIDWHELVARGSKQVDTIRPWLQRIRAVKFAGRVMWEGIGIERETLDKKKAQARERAARIVWMGGTVI